MGSAKAEMGSRETVALAKSELPLDEGGHGLLCEPVGPRLADLLPADWALRTSEGHVGSASSTRREDGVMRVDGGPWGRPP